MLSDYVEKNDRLILPSMIHVCGASKEKTNPLQSVIMAGSCWTGFVKYLEFSKGQESYGDYSEIVSLWEL